MSGIDGVIENGGGGGALQERAWTVEVERCSLCCSWFWSERKGSGAGVPLELVQPDTLRYKVMEPLLLLGKEKFAEVPFVGVCLFLLEHRLLQVDIRLRVKGGGQVSQIYGSLPR